MTTVVQQHQTWIGGREATDAPRWQRVAAYTGLVASGFMLASYTRRDKDKRGWEQLDKFRWIFAHRVDGETRVPVEYLGVWDTVKAAGLLRWDAKWPFTRNLVNIRKVRHAVSIDEYRRPYQDYLAGVYDTKGHGIEPDVYEVWFAGVHSDVGGTFADDAANHPLCKITLKWMLQGAVAAGVLVKQGPYHAMCAKVTADNARGKVHRMGKSWRILGYRKRVVPGHAKVHESVRARTAAADLKYGPALPTDAVYVDEHWAHR